jgi:hypothetical protein
MASVLPAFAGMLALALLPRDGLLWTRWGCFFITILGNIAGPSKLFSVKHVDLETDALGFSDLDIGSFKCGRANQKICDRYYSIHRLLHWQLHWISGVPGQRRTAIHSRYHCLLHNVRPGVRCYAGLAMLL